MLFFGNWRDLFSCNNRSETNPDSLPTMCGLSDRLTVRTREMHAQSHKKDTRLPKSQPCWF